MGHSIEAYSLRIYRVPGLEPASWTDAVSRITMSHSVLWTLGSHAHSPWSFSGVKNPAMMPVYQTLEESLKKISHIPGNHEANPPKILGLNSAPVVVYSTLRANGMEMLKNCEAL